MMIRKLNSMNMRRLNSLQPQLNKELYKISSFNLNVKQECDGAQNVLSGNNMHETYKKYVSRSTYSDATTDIKDAFSLFPEAYTDEDFYAIEQEKVFKKSWVAVGHKSSHLLNDGDVLSTFIGKIPIIITNYKDEMKGFYNVCRHRGSILLEEGKYSKCNVIQCPYHSWSYSCSGKLMGTPYFNDDKMPENTQQRNDPNQKNEMFKFEKVNFDKSDFNLFPFGVKEFMGTIFVNLDTDIERRNNLWKYQFGDLDEHYGYYPWEDMRTIGEYDYTINSNWKSISENFIEYYHLPWVHPELCEVSSVANHIRRQGIGQYAGFATYPLTYGGTVADPDAFEPFRNINDADKEAAWFIHIFPNISYFIYPHHIVSLITYPQCAGITKEKVSILMDKSIKDNVNNDIEIKNKTAELGAFYVMVNDQDVAAVERVQKGLECKDVYRGGRISGKFEEPIYRFQNIFVDYMTDQYLKVYPGDHDFVPSKLLKN